MPVPSRTHRAETKYNVTTEFPHLGLHSAAANGNIGLVKYALSHGQPINSVLDGVLPLHAASSGGNDLVVKLLIEQGADVNASRLPRRYSDRNRDNSAPIVGSSGSTPLHFAAANGHTDVVRILLLHGAHADRPDKHGVTPEMLARENGMENTAELLREWILNKDRDLRERAGGSSSLGGGEGGGPSPGPGVEEDEVVGSLRADRKPNPCSALDAIENSVLKRLHVKRSIDRALNTLKPSSYSLSESYANASSERHPRRLAPIGGRPPSPLGIHPTFVEYPEMSTENVPHEFDELLTPRSAQKPPPPAAMSQSPDSTALSPNTLPSSVSRKLGSKYSLRNLFKKASDAPTGPSSSDSPYSLSSAASTPSTSPSPVPGAIPLPTSPRPSHLLLSSSPHEPSPLAHRPRLGSDTSIGNLGVEMMYRPSNDHSRARSSSRTGTDGPNSTSPSRPGILLSHGRSSSSSSGQPQSQSQAQSQGSSFRALRFEASSSNSSLSAKARNGAARVLDFKRSFSPSRVVKGSGSVGSFKVKEKDGLGGSRVSSPESAPAGIADFEEADPVGDVDEEEYGEVIKRLENVTGAGASAGAVVVNENEDHHLRESSIHSSSSSLSPIAPMESSVTSTGTEFPFSINRPPPLDVLDDHRLAVPPYTSSVTGTIDNRLRGNSVSSTSTEGSNDPHLSWSATTATSSGTVMTPAISHLALPSPSTLTTPSSIPRDLLVFAVDNTKDEPVSSDVHVAAATTSTTTTATAPITFGTRRSHVPVDIDIRSISSHAQAEALVQLAQQSILEMEMEGMSDDEAPATSDGRTPLSAKLAAYGESLAIERRLKRAEEGKVGKDVNANANVIANPRSAEDRGILHSRSATFVREGGGGPKSSSPRVRDIRLLETAKPSSPNSHRARMRQPRRPNTSDSVSSGRISPFMSDRSPRSHHQQSHSASAVESHSSTAKDMHRDFVKASSPVPISQPAYRPLQSPEFTLDLSPPPRSRTPDPLLDQPSPTGRVQLSRYSTLPAQDSLSDILAAGSTHDPATRHMVSATKLTKMGFSAKEGLHPTASIPSVSPRQEQKLRFGIKSLFKGKS